MLPVEDWPMHLLCGDVVRLEPFEERHLPGLVEAGRDPEIWQFMPIDGADEQQLLSWLKSKLNLRKTGADFGWTVFRPPALEPIGLIRFKDISRSREVMAAALWCSRPHWGSAVIPDAEFLTLKFAFEVVGCARVEKLIDLENTRGLKSAMRAGYVIEGLLRSALIARGGDRRDHFVVSMLRQDWPLLARRLQGLVQRKIDARSAA